MAFKLGSESRDKHGYNGNKFEKDEVSVPGVPVI